MNAAADQALRVLIVDDEAPARNRIRDLLEDCAANLDLTVAGEAANGREALELVRTGEPDVVLLDINMPEMSGIEVAQHLQKLPDPPAVIFTTAYDNHALRAFELHAVDYLLKPIRLGRLYGALSRVRALTPPKLDLDMLSALAPQPRSNLSVQEGGKIHLIPIEDVIYLKAELKYVTLRTAAREYLLEESLSHLEQEFGERFLRIHRNCLVAKAKIAGFERSAKEGSETHWVTLLKGVAEKLPVSRRQQHVVREMGKN